MHNLFNNCLIIGSSGMIGSNINFGLKPLSHELNITDINSIYTYFNKNPNISCIINLASINLRESEEDICKSINVNINGNTNILNIAMKLNIPYVFMSSGAVFSSNNKNSKFDEESIINPNCIYGFTKGASENVTKLYNKSIIIRTGWVFGGNQKNHYKFVENTINNFLTNNKIFASNNFNGSPIYVNDLIDHIKFLIINEKFGIHNIVNDGIATGYDIAFEISKILNVNSDLIVSICCDSIPNPGPKRSKSEILESNFKFNKLRHWKISLKEYIEQYLGKKKIIIEPKINTQINIWKNRDKCRLCNSLDLKIFFNLEPTPLANHFIKHIKYQELIPLDISICNNCKHIQLIQIVDPNIQYIDYLYVSSTSQTMKQHLKENVINFVEYLNLSKNDNILEIGANDGICIKHLLDNNFSNVIGVDPAKNINKSHNLPIILDFFGSHILESLKEKYKSFKLIYAFHCCAHIENIQDVFYTIYNLLDNDGVFIMEVGYFYEVFKNKIFDVIYHEHIDYHTCTALSKFANDNNMRLFNVKENSIQGGSIQFYFCKNICNKKIEDNVIATIEKENQIHLFDFNNLLKWQNSILRNSKDINYLLNSLILNGKIIIGYGAPAKLTTFMYQYKLTNNLIKFIIDDNPSKQNLLTPGIHIPIKPFNILYTEKIDYIILFSWNFVDEIIKKLENFRDIGVRIIIPFPEIKII
jgi:dTDP-4-dehydrorhamnose reductase/SAM-dependent methyltransferase